MKNKYHKLLDDFTTFIILSIGLPITLCFSFIGILIVVPAYYYLAGLYETSILKFILIVFLYFFICYLIALHINKGTYKEFD
ncbi:MAG: hypothetical protein KGV57_04580 [Fusobacterium sp.]|nr:hypothetical protein [Fusobacterium sp.]